MRKGIRITLAGMLMVCASGLHAETSREFRASHHVGIDGAFSLVSLPFPAAKGVALNVNLSDQWQLGLSYMNSGFEVNFSKLKLAGFKERLVMDLYPANAQDMQDPLLALLEALQLELQR